MEHESKEQEKQLYKNALMRIFGRLFLLLFLLQLGGCALFQSKNSTSATMRNAPIREWFKDTMHNPTRNDYTKRFYDAYHGDPKALQASFEECLEIMNSPEMMEGDETLTWVMAALMVKWGDKRFAAQLQKAPPKVRYAVANFLTTDLKYGPKYPKTYKVLRETPKFDFPAFHRPPYI